jgi:hypothetical protein
MADSDNLEPVQNNPNEGSMPSDENSDEIRREGIKNFFRAVKHINDASVADSVKQRLSDYVTIGLVVVCILSLVASAALPVPVGVPVAFKVLPLVFTVGAVVFYIINRLGIIVSLTSRQALIVWQILIASFWLGVTSAMLVMITVLCVVNQGI